MHVKVTWTLHKRIKETVIPFNTISSLYWFMNYHATLIYPYQLQFCPEEQGLMIISTHEAYFEKRLMTE